MKGFANLPPLSYEDLPFLIPALLTLTITLTALVTAHDMWGAILH